MGKLCTYDWRDTHTHTHTVSVAAVSLINSYTVMRVQRDSPVITQTRLNSVNNCQSICPQQCVCVIESNIHDVCVCVFSQQYSDTVHFLLFKVHWILLVCWWCFFRNYISVFIYGWKTWWKNQHWRSYFLCMYICMYVCHTLLYVIMSFFIICTSNVYKSLQSIDKTENKRQYCYIKIYMQRLKLFIILF